MDSPSAKASTELDGKTSTNYAKVREWLLSYIAEKQLMPGDKMPSERMLSESMGFCRATVARAISELVEQKILTRAQRSGTYVSDYAVALPGCGRTIGIVMPLLTQDESGQITASSNCLSDPSRWLESLHADICIGAIEVFRKQGYRFHVVANNSHHDEVLALKTLNRARVDGLLVVPDDSTDSGPSLAEAIEAGIQVVTVDRYCPGIHADWVASNNLHGAEAGVRYLIDRGHRRIAFFNDFGWFTSAEQRYEGYRTALKKAGIPYDEEIVTGPQLARSGQRRLNHALEHCLRLPSPITAIFCMNDMAIAGTFAAAEHLGVKVPEQLEIAGFFDQRPQNWPGPFTRLKQDPKRMGKMGAKFLIERLTGQAPTEPRHILLPVELIPA